MKGQDGAALLFLGETCRGGKERKEVNLINLSWHFSPAFLFRLLTGEASCGRFLFYCFLVLCSPVALFPLPLKRNGLKGMEDLIGRFEDAKVLSIGDSKGMFK